MHILRFCAICGTMFIITSIKLSKHRNNKHRSHTQEKEEDILQA
jgi:preprotein translocase subunit SecG